MLLRQPIGWCGQSAEQALQDGPRSEEDEVQDEDERKGRKEERRDGGSWKTPYLTCTYT